MARPRTIFLDAPEVARRYEAGERLGDLATSYGVSMWSIRRHVIEGGRTIGRPTD